jgi:hypothetical protein
LLQVLLGDPPKEIVVFLPQLNLGPERGQQLVGKVHDWVEAAKMQMRGESRGVEVGFSLSFTDHAARNLGERDPFFLVGFHGRVAV